MNKNNGSFNIAFFGSSLLSAYWNGAATYYRGLIRALAELGHKVTFYEPDAFNRSGHRDIDPPDWAEVVVYPAQREALDKALEEAQSADIIVKASGVGVFDPELESAVLQMHAPDKKIIFWDVDAPATLNRTTNDHNDYFRELIPQYDAVLTYGGGPPVVKAYKALGAQDCIPVYNALDSTTHFPAEKDHRFSADLTFLGNRMPDRERRVWEFFFKPAGLRPEEEFLLGGSGWV